MSSANAEFSLNMLLLCSAIAVVKLSCVAIAIHAADFISC